MRERVGADFEEDPRYRIANREAWYAFAYWVVYTIAVTAVAWLLGHGKPAAEIDFIWGFPTWFFWSALVVTLIFCIIPYFIVKFLFVEASLMPDPATPDVDAEEGGTR